MHDLADAGEGRIGVEPESPEERLERAAVAFVRELGLEHVEAELPALRAVALGRNEREARAGVDEGPNEPGTRDAIDEDAGTRNPRAVAIRCELSLGPRWPSGCIEGVEGVLRRTRLRTTEEVDRADGGKPRLETRHFLVRWCTSAAGRAICRRFCTARLAQPPRRERDLVVLATARALKELAHVIGGEPIHEVRSADRRVAAALDDLRANPLEVLALLFAVGKDVHGVLHRYSTDALQPTPDLHAQVIGLGRNLVDEEQPALLGRLGVRILTHGATPPRSIMVPAPTPIARSYTSIDCGDVLERGSRAVEDDGFLRRPAAGLSAGDDVRELGMDIGSLHNAGDERMVQLADRRTLLDDVRTRPYSRQAARARSPVFQDCRHRPRR